MADWLPYALDYIPRWLDYQQRQSGVPGIAIAVARNGKVVLDAAIGQADIKSGTALNERHRFRVASHSKSFTAAGIMLLRERGKLALDDAVGRYVAGLHKQVAQASLQQLLSHGAGLVRDGWDGEQWQHRRPFLKAGELQADLARAPILPADQRFKYSNHGYGLLGMVIEAVADESYAGWIAREVIAACGLTQTLPDMPAKKAKLGFPLASGHSGRWPLGKRVPLPGDACTHAMAPATGFVSTASDLARFFAQLAPDAKHSLLSPASRRAMLRRLWVNPNSGFENYYGLGINSGAVRGQAGEWQWFGHGGSFPGYISQSAVLPAQGLSISVLTNAGDGPAGLWLDGAVQIMQAYARHGAPTRRVKDWAARWCSLYGVGDWLPMGNRILIATPAFGNPMLEATQIEVSARDKGRVALSGGFGNHGETVQRIRDGRGRVASLRNGGMMLHPEARILREVKKKFGR